MYLRVVPEKHNLFKVNKNNKGKHVDVITVKCLINYFHSILY